MSDAITAMVLELAKHRIPSPPVDTATAEREALAWRERLTPLEQRVAKVLADIPDAVKVEGLSLHAIQQFVMGRWHGLAHAGELGTALRKLGYTRERRWRGDAIGFRSLWLPPAISTPTDRK
jgi:hypothetical protein